MEYLFLDRVCQSPDLTVPATGTCQDGRCPGSTIGHCQNTHKEPRRNNATRFDSIDIIISESGVTDK